MSGSVRPTEKLNAPGRREKGDGPMALGFYFVHKGFTPEKYKQALSQLEAAGAGAPAGRKYHVALESDGAIQVFDIWDSQESLRRLRRDPRSDPRRARGRALAADGRDRPQRDRGLTPVRA